MPILMDKYFYNKNNILGKGKYSNVYFGYLISDHDQKVAIKELPHKITISRTSVPLILSDEIEILNKLNLFVEYVEDEDHQYIIMKLIPGCEFYDYVVGGPYKKENCKRFIKKIAINLKKLHDNKIAHLDLKVENIMYSEKTDELNIVDFGYSIINNVMTSNKCGSPHYVAPEVVVKKNMEYNGIIADVWSFGIIVYILMTIRFPYDYDEKKENPAAMYEKIINDGIYYPSYLDESAIRFCKFVLQKNVRMRPTIDEILDHPWLQSKI